MIIDGKQALRYDGTAHCRAYDSKGAYSGAG